ncbi:MAG: ABC transporter ATP-binding protein [Deltaproteobacteria bacterium]|nr:ABC transporter ATP-binding protein [Deltaproteobacteria bacterium]MBW2085760.1 ABC transporter ATP-binding protein [Deltaproteobacteria bacterium]
MFLQVEDLHSYYGPSHVLQGISLTVDEGEIVSLLGRNGMGKSTALKSIMGLVKPKSGQVVFKGKNLTGFPPYKVAKAGIAFVPEDRRIFPNLTVLDNLAMGVKAGQDQETENSNSWTIDRVFQHFPMLKERAKQKGKFLSGGEQQMLAIGRSLMGNPELLLIDEPTEGLSPLLVQEVRDVLAEINKAGVPILLVEHNLKVAMSLSNRIYLMGKAYIGFAGSIEELESNPEIKEKYLEV